MFQDIEDLFRMREQTELDVAALKGQDDALVESAKKQRETIEGQIRALENAKNKLDRETDKRRGEIAYDAKTLQENLYTERSYFMRQIALASLKKITPAAFSTKLLDTRYDFDKKPLRVDTLHETPFFSLRAVYFDITEKYASRGRTNTVQLYINVIACDGLAGYGYDDRGIYDLAGFERTWNSPGGHHNISYDAARLYDNRFKTLDEAAAFVERNKARWLKEAMPKMDAFSNEVAEAPAFEDAFDFRLFFYTELDRYNVADVRRHQLSLSFTPWNAKEPSKHILVRFDGVPGDVDFTVDFADPKDTYRIMQGIMETFKLPHLRAEVAELRKLTEEWEETRKKAQQVAA